ncbi:MAG: MBL fold metallo-hydrolase [Lachnospiraceae bacterium]|nr:MBL fold metallo-hydrolase [Lachnospiraceae bacterium]
MKIINLIENTEGVAGCANAHGLSFYIEANGHKLLFDLGPSAETLENAKKLGIDLTGVDLMILSHGHYDHSGGILPFAKLNPQAGILFQDAAGAEYYADDGESAGENRYRYIGIDKEILKLPQLKMINGDYVIDEGLELFTLKKRSHPLPFTNKRILEKTAEGYMEDEFKHEHYLVIREGEKSVLVSGCAHNGILSITDAFIDKYGKAPDLAVSGFHLMKKTDYTEKELEEIKDIAKELKNYPTRFVTCHCTGTTAFEVMKAIMGDQLDYVHSGETII